MGRTTETTPLYVRIAIVLRQRIEAGELPVGAMVPTLESYMNEFGVSRVTMRLAMNALEADHLISRRRGVGTIVLARPIGTRQVGLPNTWHELLARLSTISRSKFRVETSREPSDDDLNLDAHPNSPLAAKPRGDSQRKLTACTQKQYVHLIARHDHGRAAYCHVDAWLEAGLYAESKSALRSRPTLQVLITEHSQRILRVLQSTTIAVADLAVAESLGAPIGSPIALVRRTVFDADGGRLYASRISFPAAVVRWDTTLIS